MLRHVLLAIMLVLLWGTTGLNCGGKSSSTDAGQDGTSDCADCQGHSCCGTRCVNLNNDVLNCGECDNACGARNSYCDNGNCGSPPCDDGVECSTGEFCCASGCCPTGQLCCTVPGPVGSDTICSEPIDGTCPMGCVDCDCMAPNTPVATPGGYRPIASLAPGDLVYSLHQFSVRAVPILRVSRVPVNNHRVLRIVFEDGRVIIGSPGHPTGSGLTFGRLRAGDQVGGAVIMEISLIDYPFSHTCDILPDSDTGSYFAAGVRIGSTLSAAR